MTMRLRGALAAAAVVSAAPPATLPTDNMYAHYDASAITGLNDGDALPTTGTAWADQLGTYALTAVSSASGTYKASAQNGLAVVEFDGSTQSVQNASFSITGVETILAVAKLRSLPSSGSFVVYSCIGSTGTTHRQIYSSFGPAHWTFQGVNGLDSGITADTDWHVFGVRFPASGNIDGRIDATVIADLGLKDSSNQSGIRLGQGAGGTYSPSDVAEVVVYNAVLSDDDFSDAFSALGSKWGISV